MTALLPVYCTLAREQTITFDSLSTNYNDSEKLRRCSQSSDSENKCEGGVLSIEKYEKTLAYMNEVINGSQVNSEARICLAFQITPGVDFSVILKCGQETLLNKIEVKTKKSAFSDENDQRITIIVNFNEDNNNKAVNITSIRDSTGTGSRKTWEMETVSEGQCDQTNSKRDSDCFEPAWESFTESTFSVILSSAASFEVKSEEGQNCITITKFETLARATDDFDGISMQHGGCRLGSGSFGDVFLGRLSVNGMERDVAIKRFKPVFSCFYFGIIEWRVVLAKRR